MLFDTDVIIVFLRGDVVAKKTLNSLTSEISSKGVELIEKYALSHGLRIPNALIAATCICNDVELVTRNLRHYQYISGLKIRPLEG